MATFQMTKKLIKDYTAGFKVKVIDMEKITNHPTYNKVRNVLDDLEENLTIIPNVWDVKYGKLYLIVDVQHLNKGPAQATTPWRDFEEPATDPNIGFVKQQNYIKEWNYFQTL